MKGLELFQEYFGEYCGQFVIIGGTACELNLKESQQVFRATKDIDLVLIVEAMTAEFGSRIWEFVKAGKYKNVMKSSGQPEFYRFYDAEETGFPYMIELFARRPNVLVDDKDIVIGRVSAGEDVSSLSAILLNESYYEFMLGGVLEAGGLTFLSSERLIPFKAKAWLDLKEQKARGKHVNDRDLRKHKNDVYTLAVTLETNKTIELNEEIKDDMVAYVDIMRASDFDLKSIGITDFSRDELLDILIDYYNLQ